MKITVTIAMHSPSIDAFPRETFRFRLPGKQTITGLTFQRSNRPQNSRISRAGITRYSPLPEVQKGTTFVHGALQPILWRASSSCGISPNSSKHGHLHVRAKR